MTKKIIISLLVAVFLASGLPVFAQTTGSNNTTMLNCVASAVATREKEIQSAFSIFSTAKSSAFTKRASDLAAAWALADKTARNTAIKSAWSTFKKSKETARKAHNGAVKSAWTNFSTARKACKAPVTGENPGADNIIQNIE